MNRPITVAALVAMLALAGCGGQKPSGETATSSTPAARSTAAPGDAAIPDIAALDKGPRAGESPADHEAAERGEKVFQNKGCSACHAFGVKKSGPDLAGVSMRRTAAWMESQILHPEIMVKQDPIARQLFAQYVLQMPNQGLTREQARDVIEYLKHMDSKSASAKKEESR
jgi:cytochrome c2